MKIKIVICLILFWGINISFLFAYKKVKENPLKNFNDTLIIETKLLPPYVFFDENKHLQGYTTDLLDSISAKLGKPVKFVFSEKKSIMSSEETVNSTKLNHPDILFVCSCNPTYDVNKYSKGIICFQTEQALMVRRWSGIEKISNLSRKRIASLNSKWTLEQFQSMGIFPKLPLINPDSLLGMNILLLNQSIDASIADTQVQKYLLKHADYDASYLRIIPLKAMPVYYQLMVRDDSKKITIDQLQNVMSTFNRDKTIFKLKHKWFDFSPRNEIFTLNRLLSLVLAILILILLALFFIYLNFVGENMKEKQYSNLMMKILDAFPHAVNLSEIDREGKIIRSIYSNQLNKQNLEKFKSVPKKAVNTPQESSDKINDPKLTNQSEMKDSHLKFVNDHYFKKSSFLIDQKTKNFRMDIYSDVTEIIESREKADLAKRLKSTFLANMSHDIRTPLNTIIGFSQLLTETQSREELLDYSQLIKDNTHFLVDMIDDIVRLSHYKNSTIELYEKDVDLVQYRYYLLMQFSQSLKKYGKEGQFELIFTSNYSNIYTRLDWAKYLRVIMNMVTNSIKFTDKGFIEVGLFIEEEQLYFYVEDTGTGIEEEKIPSIFNTYESIDNISKSKGTGLGMAICIAVMKCMGGKVGVYSKIDVGSLFWCSFRPTILDATAKEDADISSLKLIKEKIQKSYIVE